MEIVPGFHRIDGVSQGVNAYLWLPKGNAIGAGPMVFDCGWPWSGSGLVTSMRALGVRTADVRAIAITHDDIDHTGRLASLQAVSGANVIAHEEEVARLAGERWRKPPNHPGAIGVLMGLGDLFYARSAHRAVRVDCPVRDGSAMPGGWVAVHTPGHTPGHCSYFLPSLGVLVAGDALGSVRRGQIRTPAPIYTEDMGRARESVRRLAELQPAVVCFGHGRPLFDAAVRLRSLAASL